MHFGDGFRFYPKVLGEIWDPRLQTDRSVGIRIYYLPTFCLSSGEPKVEIQVVLEALAASSVSSVSRRRSLGGEAMPKRLIALGFLASSCLVPPLVGGQAAATHKVLCTAVPAGKIVKFVRPIYPAEVTAKAIAEGVVVKLTIDKQGVPRDLRVTKGDPILAKAALEALQQWRWKPYTLNGEPVEVESSVYIGFDPLAN